MPHSALNICTLGKLGTFPLKLIDQRTSQIMFIIWTSHKITGQLCSYTSSLHDLPAPTPTTCWTCCSYTSSFTCVHRMKGETKNEWSMSPHGLREASYKHDSALRGYPGRENPVTTRSPCSVASMLYMWTGPYILIHCNWLLWIFV